MNWDQFKRNVGMRFQFEPRATRLAEDGSELPQVELDDWILLSAHDDTTTFQNVRDQVQVQLGKDCLYDYRTDKTRDTPGSSRHGIAVLKVHIFIRGINVHLRANSRPGEPITERRIIAPNWTPYVPIDLSTSVPPLAKTARLQFRLSSPRPNVPLLARLAGSADGRFAQEMSGPSFVATQQFFDGQSLYLSLAHESICYEVGVLGFEMPW